MNNSEEYYNHIKNSYSETTLRRAEELMPLLWGLKSGLIEQLEGISLGEGTKENDYSNTKTE